MCSWLLLMSSCWQTSFRLIAAMHKHASLIQKERVCSFFSIALDENYQMNLSVTRLITQSKSHLAKVGLC